MSRIPILPTIIVAAAVAVMIGLGVWQLQRAQWKERLLAEYVAAASLPALDLDPLVARPEAGLPPLAFRRVLVTCRATNIAPIVRGGRSHARQGGYVYLIPCRAGAQGLAGRLLINMGWTPLPSSNRRLSLDGIAAGWLGAVEAGQPIILTSAIATPPLTKSAPANIEDVPNNHFFYALQWFFFAGIAVLIYALALRRRAPPELPPEP